MKITIAPAVLALFTQANLQAPDRDESSDGTVASAQHHLQNPTSDHEPDAVGWVYAGDLTDDDAHGIDCRKIAAQIVARKDRRVKYLIHEGRMVSSYPTSQYPAWTWRPYSGPNGHFHHLHVSVLAQWRNDTSPWWTTDTPTTQEDDMTDEQAAQLANVEAMLKKFTAERRADHKDTDPRFTSGSDLLTKVDELGAKVDALAAKIGAQT